MRTKHCTALGLSFGINAAAFVALAPRQPVSTRPRPLAPRQLVKTRRRPVTPRHAAPPLEFVSAVGAHLPLADDATCSYAHRDPDVLILRDFVSSEDCDGLLAAGRAASLEKSPVEYAGWTEDAAELLQTWASGPAAWILPVPEDPGPDASLVEVRRMPPADVVSALSAMTIATRLSCGLSTLAQSRTHPRSTW